MSKKGWVIIAFYTVILMITFWVLFGKKFLPAKEVHYHAGFVVFSNNKKLDFSDNKYMNITPCTDNKAKEYTEKDKQLEKAHLHDNVGDVVHVEAADGTWSDLFTNIHYPIDYTMAIGFINGQKVANFQKQTIESYDSLVVFIGENDTKHLKEAVTKAHIQQKEKKSDTCQ